MATQTLIEKELAELIVGALNLDADPQTIEPDAPLYLEGLGLDSIDLLELSVVISKKYGFQIKSDDPDIETIFSSLKDLGTTVTTRKTTG
jgi:acyl carrier protein